MIEYILITAVASFINIYATTAVMDTEVSALETKATVISIEDVTGREFN